MRTFWGVVLILVCGAVPGWAALGEAELSVGADQQVLHGQRHAEAHEGFTIHQITDPAGGTVREYVGPSGRVFGISWQGPFVPNMQQLLGTYFTRLEQYNANQTTRHAAPLVIQQNDFVFSSGGHMRAYRGRAYVPNLVPAHLTAEVVQ